MPAPLNDVEVLVRAEGRAEDLQRAIEAIRTVGGRPGLWLAGIDASAPYEALIPSVHRLVLDVTVEKGGPDELAFRLKSRITEMRGVASAVRIGIAATEAALGELRQRGAAPYLDFVAVEGQGDRRPAFFPSLAPIPFFISLWTPGDSEADRGFEGWLLPLPVDVVDARQAVSDVAAAAPLLKPGLIRGGMADIRCGGTAPATYLDPESLDTVAVVEGCGASPVVVSPDIAGVTRVPLSSGAMVVRVPPAEGRFAEGVRVVGSRALGVREIIARHQAAAARQRRKVQRLISTGRMTLTFEAPGFPAPIAITSEAVIFTAPDAVEIQQGDIRVNGIAFQGGSVPRLPLLEPERVASPPLAISLTDVYRYALEREEEEGGVRCYVLSFSPLDRTRLLFSGRAWIAMDDFGMVKVSAVQTGLRGPIVSSEQTDVFRRQDSLWLLASSDIRQQYEGAGHRTPIHRVLAIDRHEVNPPAFVERRQAAYASPAIMLRDTPEGFRYLRRERGAASGGTAAAPAVGDRAERVRTIALGVILDPNISRPLPFAGLSYVDFNLFGTGTQVNGFFGGTYGQLAVAVPSLGGTRWQLGGQAFGIASSYNDRAFVNGRELYDRNIAQRPAHAAVWVLRPLSARFTARAGYDFDYTHYGRVGSTAPSFTVPPSQVVHALRVALEGQWAGWSATAWWSGARRAGWREWGGVPAGEAVEPDPYEPRHADFQRGGASVTRSFVASPRLVGRVEAGWMSGRDLDRFSRYAFGSFDNRLRGYPSALIRYDRGAVLRTSIAWAAGRLLRLDGFADTAYVRDPGFGRRSRSYTGLGAAAEMPAPFGTLVAVEWGYGFQGVNSDGTRGTQVVRISGYKMF